MGAERRRVPGRRQRGRRLLLRTRAVPFPHAQALGEADAALIAYYRTACPQLADEVERLQGQVRRFFERAADEKLDGYRELGQRAADAENAADKLEVTVKVCKHCRSATCQYPDHGFVSDTIDGIPRRNRVYMFSPAERAIWDAAQAVEAAGCDPRLTRAVNLLHEARESVANYVDGVPTAPFGHISKADECQTDEEPEVAALRAKLAKYEAVVEAARGLNLAAYLVDFTADPDRYAKLGEAREAIARALRALDESSGGSGAATTVADAAPSRVPPEPAGGLKGGDADDDPAHAPVQVAPPADSTSATGGTCGEWLEAADVPCALPRGHFGVCDPYSPGVRQPTLREIHATTRGEVAQLRARIDAIVPAIHRAASRVGGPGAAALQALAEELEQ